MNGLSDVPAFCPYLPCGVPLAGAQTRHKPDCILVAIFRDHFGKAAADQVTAPSIACPKCGARSYHPKDIAEGFCGRCHDWTTARDPRG